MLTTAKAIITSSVDKVLFMKRYKQHYVPRSILRNFENSKRVSCLLKDQDGKIIESDVANLCSEKDFYSFSLDLDDESTDKTLDYDKKIFDDIDDRMASVTKKIVDSHSIDVLDVSEKSHLAKYVVYQYIRSPAVKDIATSLTKDEKDARQIQGLTLLDKVWIQKVTNIINSFSLKLVKPTSNVDFIISDSPVLWSPTAEGIYFPISPKDCLCYQVSDSNPLDSICINELEFLTSTRFNISQKQTTLDDIWRQVYQEHINTFCQSKEPSFWKCMLSMKNSSDCILQFEDHILEEFKELIEIDSK